MITQNITITKSIKSLSMIDNGTVDVYLSVKNGEIDLPDEHIVISAEKASTFLDISDDSSKTLRDRIINTIYSYIINNGLSAGNILE